MIWWTIEGLRSWLGAGLTRPTGRLTYRNCRRVQALAEGTVPPVPSVVVAGVDGVDVVDMGGVADPTGRNSYRPSYSLSLSQSFSLCWTLWPEVDQIIGFGRILLFLCTRDPRNTWFEVSSPLRVGGRGESGSVTHHSLLFPEWGYRFPKISLEMWFFRSP